MGPTTVTNFQPVSLTSVVCKFFERILKRATFPFLIQCEAFICCQHGFLLHRSCFSNLLTLGETITRLMDDGNTAGVVYLDFAKTFESVYHSILSAKPKSFSLWQKVLSHGKNLPSARYLIGQWLGHLYTCCLLTTTQASSTWQRCFSPTKSR